METVRELVKKSQSPVDILLCDVDRLRETSALTGVDMVEISLTSIEKLTSY